MAKIDVSDRNQSVQEIVQYFDYEHLKDQKLYNISAACSNLLEDILSRVGDKPELTAGIRKLLEAKDCFVRAALPIVPEPVDPDFVASDDAVFHEGDSSATDY